MSPRVQFIPKKGTDVSDADAGVGDVRTGKTFYSVAPPRKTGTIPEVAIVAGSENVPAGIHTATTLSAIDADLAVGNIKSGVVIFGFTGTFVSTLTEDIVGKNTGGALAGVSSVTAYYHEEEIAATATYTGSSKTQTYAAGSLAVGSAYFIGRNEGGSAMYIQIDMGGVIAAESQMVGGGTGWQSFNVIGTRALSGSTACHAKIENKHASIGNWLRWFSEASGSQKVGMGVTAGSVKTA